MSGEKCGLGLILRVAFPLLVDNMPRMTGFHRWLSLCALVVLLAVPCVAKSADKLSPDDTVKKYLAAMQAQSFDDAYECVSSGMRGAKTREEWVKEQQYVVQLGEVKIFGFQVFPAVTVADVAKVPNILKSQDKYLNQLGLDEYELYTLVQEEGQWRIDQQTLVEGAERKEYFPEQ